MTDAALVHELLAQRAFVRKLARRLASDGHAADELEQETLRAALAQPARSAGELRPWLATLARNAARRVWRADERRLARERATARAEAQPATDALVERAQTMRRAVEAVLALPARQREVVLLRFYEGLTVRAVAERIGASPEVVKSRTARGLRTLRAALDDAHDGRRAAWLLALSPGAGSGFWTTAGILMTTRSVAALAVALLLGLGAWQIAQRALEPDATTELAEGSRGPGVSTGSRSAGVAARVEREPAGAPEALPGSDAIYVRGRVVDQLGAAVERAGVAVLGEEDPFDGADGAELGWNQYSGQSFTTDAEGRFAARLPGPERVLVVPLRSPLYTFEPGSQPETWVDAPAEGLEFVVTRRATAILRARLVDGESGEWIEDFSATVRVDGGMLSKHPSEAGLIEWELPVPETGGITLTVSLVQPRSAEPVVMSLSLAQGELREVELVLGGEGALNGRVVDRQGQPIEGALVWFGTLADGRGDEPFKPFQPRRISGTRTSADGRFRLPGGGQAVTAWHEQYGARTASSEEATRIVLPPRGAVRGLVRDAQGRPVAGLELTLDREACGRTSADGRFVIEHVQPGVRGLTLGDRRSFALRVTAGEVMDVTIEAGVPELRLVFTRAGVEVARDAQAALIGLGEAAPVVFLEPDRDGEVRVARELSPGAYLYLAADGAVARCELDADRAVVELGLAELVVRGVEAARLGIAPAESDELVHLLAARLAPRSDANGELHLGPLVPGTYHLVGHAGRVEARVEVTAPSTELDLSAR